MSYLNSTLLPQKGAHPVSTSTIHLAGPSRQYAACTLHLHYTLPPLLFVDTHELAQRHTAYSFAHWGTRDIERPAHALPDEPSELLLSVVLRRGGTPDVNANSGSGEVGVEADGADSDDADTDVRVEVPMHLRYGAPQARSPADVDGQAQTKKPYMHLAVSWPTAFLRCPGRTFIALPSFVRYLYPGV